MLQEITEELLREVIRKRPNDSYKGTFGRAVLAGGEPRYAGAILMAAEACICAGAGLTTVITAKENHSPLLARRPEAMAVDWQDFATTEAAIETADVLLVGPGLGTSEKARKLLDFFLEKRRPDQWLVIDGSAITLLAESYTLTTLSYKLHSPETVVFTPHQMEWQRLSGILIADQNEAANRAAAAKLAATVVIKSHHTQIYTADGLSFKNPYGSPAMATGGSGDTLAGMITGFLAQFPRNGTTVAAAVALHSLIADDFAQKQYVVLPTAISAALPRYMARFASETN
ncbi:NAD(P)H-hydrate dehydratase [Enterococcus sp. AD013-P3]|uniref:NAD(P)H-hydrate dehydratase n=1 Tax=Enterococcus sp. AD013-P3 TaxID=3411036 RepID=UPI003B958939